MLQRAVFCFEELLVHNPRSMSCARESWQLGEAACEHSIRYNILTYAELLYSTGDLETSRKCPSKHSERRLSLRASAKLAEVLQSGSVS